MRRYFIENELGERLRVDTNLKYDLQFEKMNHITHCKYIVLNGVKTKSDVIKISSHVDEEFSIKLTDSETGRDTATTGVFNIYGKMLKITGLDSQETITIDILDNPQGAFTEEVTKGQFPLWKVVFEEYPYFRKDEICKCRKMTFYVRDTLYDGFKEIYCHQSGDFAYASHKASIILDKLKENYDMVKNIGKYDMFECQGVMFKLTYYCDGQFAVCGEAIDEGFINEYEDDNTVKLEILETNISFFEKDTIVASNGKVYLNCKLLATRETCETVFGFTYADFAFMPEGLRKKLTELYPEAKAYETLHASGGLK